MGREPGSKDEDPPAPEITHSWVSASDESEAASVGASIAGAYISQGLFGKGGRKFGRFELDRLLGSGGMGVVWAAKDPELQRTVALKIVRVAKDDSEKALTEARALARLAHPNVVPIFDVGIDGKDVYIVMELVEGETLKRWTTGRRPREIVKAYLQAGEALAAAHDKGLVHRDFKPANAIMGADGRVRVVDFGLAFRVADEPGGNRAAPSVAGTRGYMAPEQAVGAPVTEAVNQFSFCVALAEALGRTEKTPHAALPRWLERIVARGTAPEPAARFPTMRALLKELANDPVTVWRRRALVSAVVVVGAAAFVTGRATLAARDPACAGIGDRLAAAWGGVDRGAALARLGALDAYGKSLQPLLASHLGDHARRWIAGYEDACVAHRREIQSDQVFDRRVSCLERSRAGLKSFAAIMTSSDAKGLPAVALAMQAVPDPDACSDLAALDSDVNPPPAGIAKEVARLRNELGDARVRVAAGRYDDAQALAARTAQTARTLGYRPLLAEALVVEGHAAMSLERRLVAIPLLTEAARIAFETGPRSLAVEAWARRAWLEGTVNDQANALSGYDVVEAVASNASTGSFARALFHNNVGGVELALEHRDRARAAFERAVVDARDVKGPGAVELVVVRTGLAFTSDDPARRVAILSEADAAMAALVGNDHPRTLFVRQMKADETSGFRAASEILEGMCSRFEPFDPVGAARCWSDLGFVKGELGDVTAAVKALERASLDRAVDGTTFQPTVPGYLALWRGDPKAAVSHFQAALAKQPGKRPEEPFWERVVYAAIELGLGRAYAATGDVRAARLALNAGLGTLEDVAPKHPTVVIDRLLGRARAELAKVLARSGGRADEISKLTRSAVDWFTLAGGDPAEIRDLERLARPDRTVSARRD